MAISGLLVSGKRPDDRPRRVARQLGHLAAGRSLHLLANPSSAGGRHRVRSIPRRCREAKQSNRRSGMKLADNRTAICDQGLCGSSTADSRSGLRRARSYGRVRLHIWFFTALRPT
jgi:hypothetical protein